MVICDYCQTTVYWDADNVARMGAQSVLPDADTRLYMGATGTILGKRYEVAGHVRYEHYRGGWDEWYLSIEGGKAAWVSEDERNLTLERKLKPSAPLPPREQLTPGMRLELSGHQFTVREIGRAKCVGGEGQLPFAVLPDEEYPYLDIASQDGQQFGTIEYDEEGAIHAYLGRPLEHQQLTLDAPKPERETDVSDQAQDVDCPHCGAPLEPPRNRQVETLVCEYCGAQNDLTGAKARVMGVNPEGEKPDFTFEIGQAGQFEGARYEVCGRLVHRDDEGYVSHEYLLWNPERGYLWLGEEDGHYQLTKPTRQRPEPDPLSAGPLLKPKSPIKVGDQQFEFYEACDERVVYVDGALPWLASVSDQFGNALMVAPPRLYEMEYEGGEVEYFQGRYLSAAEVWQAFGMSGEPPLPKGVHPAQPYRLGETARTLMIVGGIFALINLGLLIWSYLQPSRELIFETSFGNAIYAQEATSHRFQVGEDDLMAMEVHAPVRNGWVYLESAFIDSNDKVRAEVGAEVSYYSGPDWSEGSRTETVEIQAPPPGTYRMIAKGSRGDNPNGSSQVAVKLYQGGMLSRYYLILAIVLALFPAYAFARQHLFESRRWSPVIEDEDDD